MRRSPYYLNRKCELSTPAVGLETTYPIVREWPSRDTIIVNKAL